MKREILNKETIQTALEIITQIFLTIKKVFLGMMPHLERIIDQIVSNNDGVNLFTSLLN